MKTSGSIESLTQVGKGRVGVNGDNKVGYDGNELDRSEIDSGKVNDEFDNKIDNEVRKKCQKTSKSKNLFEKFFKS